MSLLWMDGFDIEDLNNQTVKYDPGSGSPFGTIQGYSADAGRFTGSSCLSIFSTQQASFIKLTGQKSTMIIGMAVQAFWVGGGTPQYYTLDRFFTLSDHGIIQVGIRWTASGQLQLDNDSGIIATSTNTFPFTGFFTGWIYLELKITFGTSGTYELRVNGLPILTGTGNTSASGNAYADRAIIYYNSVSNSGMRWDDYYICDSLGTSQNDFLGPCRVDTAEMQTDTINQFTPSSGSSNVALLQEQAPSVSPNDTSYVYTKTVNNTDLFTPGTFTGISNGLIQGIQSNVIFKKDDIGRKTIAPVLMQASSLIQSIPVEGSPFYKVAPFISTINPATGLPWLTTEVYSTSFGYKAVN